MPTPPPNRRLSIRVRGRLDLEATLYSGQAFRWRRTPDGRHRGFVANRPVEVGMADGRLECRGPEPPSPARLRSYFRLDATHDAFLRGAPPDPLLGNALRTFPGLRLLRQDPWETMVSFVISQNSHEAKIRATIEALCRAAGRPIAFDRQTLYRFPSAAALAALRAAALRGTGMGYRAPYVRGVARRVRDGALDPDGLAAAPYSDAFRRLLELPGIGEKVADCILLYGCGHLEAFPTDVWVRRLVHESYYRPRRRPSHERLRAFAWRKFGPSAGYAQHYLFHYRRARGRLAASPA